MLSIVEKVIILQSVDLLSEVPTEQLSVVAAVTEEVSFGADEEIYRELGPSDAMYIVLEGRVQLSRGEQVVTVAEHNEPFGTWALFDDEPRVMSAKTLQPSRLLRLGQDDFIEALADDVRITRAVLRALIHRLRSVAGRVVSARPNTG